MIPLIVLVTDDTQFLRIEANKESSGAKESHLRALTGRVENWRAGLGRCLCSLFLALSYARATISQPCHVSNSRLVKRSVRFSRTTLSFCLHSKGYDAYRLTALSSL